MNQKGFTLIELIMVIVILGILAATAVPKFVDLKQDAMDARRDNLTGALRSTIGILHANYILNTSATYDVNSVVGSVDASGLLPVANGANQITASADGATYSWTYTDMTGVQSPATLSDPS